MKKEVRLSLAYRDMWQSWGQFFPVSAQLRQVSSAIIGMGCFDRVETNGGAFEQVCLLMGENPNKAVREFVRPFHEAGIQTQMLERGLSALRMNPVPADVRELMFKVKKAQGVDVARSFCGLNDHRNLLPSIEYAHKAGMISQVALSISPSQTLEFYLSFVDKVVEYGCDEICVKDMSGVATPAFIRELIYRIKRRYHSITVHYHTHGGPGFSENSILEAARAGLDYIDVAVQPLAWGKGHPEVSAVRTMLVKDGFLVKDIDNQAYNAVKSMNHEYMSEFMGRGVRSIEPLLVESKLPGGMIGSLMADLPEFLTAVNYALQTQTKDSITMEQLISDLLQEIDNIWPLLGCPPLVTPYSQYVKNTAMMNLLHIYKGQPRWTMIDKDAWNMILGRMGQLPGTLAPEIIHLAQKKGLEFYDGNPQDLYPPVLERYRGLMESHDWDRGPDDEELLEFAMHERQYMMYKKKSR